jgi:hypothetical protein
VQGSYAVLLGFLQPLKACLRELRIEIDTSNNNDQQADILENDVLPCEGLKDFKCLQALTIPDDCVFGPTGHQWPNGTPTPRDLLPSSIITLENHSPRIAIFDCLITKTSSSIFR